MTTCQRCRINDPEFTMQDWTYGDIDVCGECLEDHETAIPYTPSIKPFDATGEYVEDVDYEKQEQYDREFHALQEPPF